MKLRVKICGITQVEQGRAIAEMGATALGFICASQSTRYVTPEKIRLIVDNLPMASATEEPICDRIGVFVNASLETICHVVTVGRLSGVQLHGDESSEFCDHLRQLLPNVEIIKALRIKTPDDLGSAIVYQDTIDTLLLDAYHPNLLGGTGKTLDWQTLRQFRFPHPWLLAGGLTPENVLEALEFAQPTGIDLSSGVENAPGDKDLQAVDRLLSKLRTWEYADS